MDSIEGKALVASPYLTERNFLRSVVYILRHDEDGAFGLILNRPTELTVGDLMERFSDEPCTDPEPIYYGGPVEGPLLVIHDRADGSESDDFEYCAALGLFVATDQDVIFDIWEIKDCRYRTFDGYSGWSAGQLEHELKAGGWLVWDAPPDAVFADPEPMWKQAVQQIGREILTVQIDASRIPSDPHAN
jgi:putative transcriptional regulator